MSIFISYRRGTSKHLARLIYSELRARGLSVFLDVNTIDSGEFDRIIIDQIASREHFLLILSPGSLDRCKEPNDWLRREIEQAFRLKRNIVPVFDEGFNIENEKVFLPEHIRELLPKLNAPPYSHYYFDAFIDALCTRFFKAPAYGSSYEVATSVTSEDVEKESTAERPTVTNRLLPSIYQVIGDSFAWINVPAGRVRLSAGGYVSSPVVYDVPAFSIAKYPITNTQFGKFIEAGGYSQKDWWTEGAWQAKEKEKWELPRYWKDPQWNSPHHPVVAISWFEALAYCLWLRETTGESIMLPTEQQWQRAAQGDSEIAYPWGDEVDLSRCNFNGSGTTPVDQFEAVGSSPVGVVDMSGNVWEWCLTGFDSGLQDYDSSSRHRVLRGGSWVSKKLEHIRTDYRFGNPPVFWNFDRGFRIAKS